MHAVIDKVCAKIGYSDLRHPYMLRSRATILHVYAKFFELRRTYYYRDCIIVEKAQGTNLNTGMHNTVQLCHYNIHEQCLGMHRHTHIADATLPHICP